MEKPKFIVHVITPNGTHFESLWPVGTPDQTILAGLNAGKRVFGYNKPLQEADPILGRYAGKGRTLVIPKEDKNSGFRYDHPDTIVAIGRIVNNQFVEERRLKGPPVAKTEEKAIEAELTAPASEVVSVDAVQPAQVS